MVIVGGPVTQLPFFGQPPDTPERKPAADRVVRLQVLVTVKAAPNPSDKYGETVCVAGLSTDLTRPGWVRLYPVNFRELGKDSSFKKYDVVSVEAVPARQDSRRESWRPRMPTLRVEHHLTGWPSRQRWLDAAISDTTMCQLHRGATMDSQSLALIRPKKITGLRIARHPGWSPSQQAKIDGYISQISLFENEDRTPLKAPRFAGTYHYECEEPGCRGHKQGFIDWEFVAFQLLRLGGVNDLAAKQHLERRFLDEICSTNNDVAFYVGNQAAHPRTFSVLGVYYPRSRRSGPR